MHIVICSNSIRHPAIKKAVYEIAKRIGQEMFAY
jgi:hypothetical protein